MNRKFTIALSVISLSVTATYMSGCTKKDIQAAPGGKEVSKKEIWTCPMHPQIKKDGPGSCPICGMNLVKASEDSMGTSTSVDTPEGHAAIHLNETRRQMIGVKFGEVRKDVLFKSVEAAGRVAFDPELYTAQNEYIEAISQVERVRQSPLSDVKHSAERMMESAKLRLKILGLSDKQISGIKNSGNSGSNLLIPKQGENFWIYAEVYEMDLASIQPGLDAVITGSSLGGKTLTGKVVSVDRVINTSTRSAKVRISITEGKSLLRPESYVDVSIQSPQGIQVIVPFDAVLDTGKEAWVFVSGKNGELIPKKVTIKFRAGDLLAIESGLEGGEKIVTSANFLVDSESRLKGTQLAQSNEEESQGLKKKPECPSGEEWHEQMGHCMKKAGH